MDDLLITHNEHSELLKSDEIQDYDVELDALSQNPVFSTITPQLNKMPFTEKDLDTLNELHRSNEKMPPDLTDDEKVPLRELSDVVYFTPNETRDEAGIEQRAFAKRRTENLQNKENHRYMSYLNNAEFFETRWRPMIYFFD